MEALARRGDWRDEATVAAQLDRRLTDRWAEPSYSQMVGAVFGAGNPEWAYALLSPPFRAHIPLDGHGREFGAMRTVVEHAVHDAHPLDPRWLPLLHRAYLTFSSSNLERGSGSVVGRLRTGLVTLIGQIDSPARREVLLELSRGRWATTALVAAALRELTPNDPRAAQLLEIGRSCPEGHPAAITRAALEVAGLDGPAVFRQALDEDLESPDWLRALPVAAARLQRDEHDPAAWSRITQDATDRDVEAALVGTRLTLPATVRRRLDEFILQQWPGRPPVDVYGTRQRARLALKAWRRLGGSSLALTEPPRSSMAAAQPWPFRFYGPDGRCNDRDDEFRVIVRFVRPIALVERREFQRASGLWEEIEWFDDGRFALFDVQDFMYDVASALRAAHHDFPLEEAMNTSIRDLAGIEDPWFAWSMWMQPQPLALPAPLAARCWTGTLWAFSDWPELSPPA